jgi:kelch-like protein 1/4/5
MLAGSVYVLGGYGYKGGSIGVVSTTYRFDIEANEWATLAPIPEAKFRSSVCELDGLIYVMGGEGNRQGILNSVFRFNPVANSWSVVTPLSVARAEFGTFVLGGRIYAVGGPSMESYYVGSNRWSKVSNGELSYARNALSAQTVRLNVNVLDMFMAKAEQARR